jgi:hypothetical protein
VVWLVVVSDPPPQPVSNTGVNAQAAKRSVVENTEFFVMEKNLIECEIERTSRTGDREPTFILKASALKQCEKVGDYSKHNAKPITKQAVWRALNPTKKSMRRRPCCHTSQQTVVATRTLRVDRDGQKSNID